MAGNPLTVCIGNKFQQTVDYRSAGINSLQFIRSYNSEAVEPSVMGESWQNNWERKLNIVSFINAVRPDGQVIKFTKSGGVWHAPSDIPLTLVESSGTYTLTLPNGTEEAYDGDGILQSVTFANGYEQTLTYTSGQLTEVSDNQGRALTFTYNSDGLLETMTDPEGNVTTYTYTDTWPSYPDAQAWNLATVVYPDNTPSPTDNPTVTYHYEDTNFPSFLTGITDELGNRFATFGYNSGGYAVMTEHADGAEHYEITTNTDGTKTVTSPLGQDVKYTFDTIVGAPKPIREDRLVSASVPAAYRTFTYDSNGYLASATDWEGTLTTFINNSRGLQTSRTEADGDPEERTITTTWDSTLALPTQIVAPRKTTDFTYDSGGNLLTWTETDTTSQSVPYSTNGDTRTWTWTYDSLGHVLTANGPRTDVTDVTTYTYDSSGNLSTVTDALSHVTTINTYNDNGLPTQYTDANGTVTNFTYDARDRLLTRTVVSSGGNATTTFTYDAAGLLTEIALPGSVTLTYEYDDAHRLTAVEDASGGRIEYTLDDAGNITEQNIKNASSTIVQTQSATFDTLSRMLEAIGATSAIKTTYAYDGNGNVVSISDALSNTTTQAFDPLNRLISVTSPLSHTTEYGYDDQDNLTSVTSPRSLVTNYIYDGFGSVIQKTSPDTGATVYTLDKAGNVVSETDARSVVTNRTFDALNRVTAETFPASTGENIAYGYDSTSGGNKGIGHLTGMTDEGGTSTFKYDDRGNVISDIRQIGGKTYNTYYQYDLADRVTQITYPIGHVVGFGYDTEGRINAVSWRPYAGGTFNALAVGVSYEPFGPMKSFLYGNGLTRTHTHDANYRLTGIETKATGVDIQDLTLSYDNASHITGITDNLNSSQNQTFTYTDEDRLEQADGVYGTLDYTYDADGNRTAKDSDTYSYPSTSNHLSSTSTKSFTYTANGQTATDDRGSNPDATYTYSNRNRYKDVTISGTTTSYKYNGFGERVSKTTGSTIVHYNYDENGRLIQESNGSTGYYLRTYVWLGNMPLAQVEPGGSIYYIHPDHQNTPQKITNSSKSIVWNRVQDPFGEQVSLTGTLTHNPRFPGQYYDAESGLNYNYFRDYDSTLGRYIEADPIGLDGGINLYGYVGQSPVMNVDPNGNIVWVLPGLYEAAVFGGEAAVTAWRFYKFYQAASTAEALMNIPKSPAEAAKDEAASDEVCPTRNSCPPCNPPAGTQCYVVNMGHTHNGWDPHYHLYRRNQSPPPACECFWNKQHGPSGTIEFMPFNMLPCSTYPDGPLY